jgi:hypothetical protein
MGFDMNQSIANAGNRIPQFGSDLPTDCVGSANWQQRGHLNVQLGEPTGATFTDSDLFHTLHLRDTLGHDSQLF